MSGVLARAVAAWPDPGACVVVVGPGGPLASVGDLHDPRPWASVTKLVTALTVLDGVERGVVALEDAVGPPGAQLADLLDHSSGLDFDGRRVVAPPGARRVYGNAGPQAAADHLAGRAGVPFEELLTAAVLGPVGATASRLTGPAAHGLLAPTGDLALLARELLAPEVLSAGAVDVLRTVRRPGLAGVLPGFGRHPAQDWGAGAEVRGAKAPHWTGSGNDPTTFGHFGASGTSCWVDRAAGLACVTSSREPFGPWAVERWPALADAVLERWG